MLKVWTIRWSNGDTINLSDLRAIGIREALEAFEEMAERNDWKVVEVLGVYQ